MQKLVWVRSLSFFHAKPVDDKSTYVRGFCGFNETVHENLDQEIITLKNSIKVSHYHYQNTLKEKKEINKKPFFSEEGRECSAEEVAGGLVLNN